MYNTSSMKQSNNKRGVSPYLLVILSFVGVILLGSFLLTMPFSHQDGKWGNFVDSLFVSTSATCVTGLCTYPAGIGGELTLAGQIITLVMIQIGGLGFITIFAFIVSIFQRRLKFKDRLFLSLAVNSTTIAQVGKFVKRVVGIVLTIEIIGFLLGLPVFLAVPGFDTGKAIWASAFTAVSAFNNAGFDIFGSTSLILGVGNSVIDALPAWAYYYLLSYIMVLIIMGGISFLVIIEIFINHRKPKQWSSFTRIVLLTTSILIVLGFGVFCLSDSINGNISPFHALFQSVTTRTAGFASFDQGTLSHAGKTMTCLLMFIGGSPISTAGGIKTTTLFMIIISFIRFVQGKKIVAFRREYTRSSILKATSLVFLGLSIVISAYMTIISLEAANPLATSENVLFEVFSAFGTVGLSANLTTTLSVGSKIIICLLMFFGRLGPITMFQIFQTNMENEEQQHFNYISTDVIIG